MINFKLLNSMFKSKAITLSFPNRTRSFDEVRNAVRFIGYDNLSEVLFFIEVAALSKPIDGVYSQAACLSAFDDACDMIHDVAQKVYSRKKGTSYLLKTTDF